MTQAVLAGLAGVSQSYISQVEAGHLGVERRATLVAIAAALKITVADLVGQLGDPTDPLKADAANVVPAIWAALIEIEDGERRAPTRTREQLYESIRQVMDLRVQGTIRPWQACCRTCSSTPPRTTAWP
jgi:transcriptional regulator with XRE-family HTH domain